MKLLTALLVLILGMIFGLTSCNRKAHQRAAMEQLARDAFAFGYPLVLMDASAQYAAAISGLSTKQKTTPMYQFFHSQKISDPRFKEVLNYESEMAVSSAWLNLSRDPVVLTVPDSGGRYYVGGFVEGWSDIFSVIGSRSTGTKKKIFFISGPQWQGGTPKGMTALQAQTNLVWLPIQFYTNGGKSLAAAASFQEGLKITPFSHWGKNGRSQEFVKINSKIDLKQNPRDYIFSLSAAEYYHTLCALMMDNPSPALDETFMQKLRKLGVLATKNFRFSDLPIESQDVLNASLRNARSFMLSQQQAFAPTGRLVNGWTVPGARTAFGVDYQRRAYAAYTNFGELPPQDAVFATVHEDNMGQQLMGENYYKLTFAKGQLPMVNAFWSVTMYMLPEMAFAGNKIKQRSVGSMSSLKTNVDGSVSIYLQPKSPGKDRESNWLMSKRGNYQLTMKLYWPKNEVLEGRWSPPVVERVQQDRMAQF